MSGAYLQFIADAIASGKIVEDGACLRWTGTCAGKNQHPCINKAGKTTLVRRLLWEKEHGPVPAGKILRCNCETRRCVDLRHVEVTTFKKLATQLGALGVMSGPVRSAKIAATNRERHPLMKISQDDARAIRESSESGVVLAARYGVTAGIVSKIRLGKVRREFAATPWQGLGG